MYQALYRKWRPQRFDDVVGQRHITQTLKNQVASSRVSHAYLFTGTRGTGKTTCAKLLARAVNCEHPVDGNPCNECPSCRGILDGSILDILELDAASNTGVDNMRAILEETIYPPANVQKRVYIIDEVHMLSAGAFNALLKTLEEPPEYVMFILATTELNRVAATVQSRCQRFDFKRISQTELAANLSRICQAEQITIAPDALEMLARLADGSARDSLSLLERCLSQREDRCIDLDCVVNALGVSPSQSVDALARAIAAMDSAAALTTLNQLYMDGRELRSILETLALYLRDILLVLTAPASAPMLLSPENDTDALRETARRFVPRRVVDCIGQLQKTVDALPRSSAGRLESELCLIKLCTPELMYTTDPDMSGRIAALESKLSALSLPDASAHAAAPTRKEAMERPDGASGSFGNAVSAIPAPDISVSVSASEPPPFTDADIPPWDESAFQVPPMPEQASVSPLSPSEKPKKTGLSQPSGTGNQDEKPAGAFGELDIQRKKSLIDAVKPKLSRSVSTYLILSKMYPQGDTLTISVESDLAKRLLDKPEIKTVVADAAKQQWAQPNIKIAVCIGNPAEQKQAVPSGFDQIISSGRDAGIEIDFK